MIRNSDNVEENLILTELDGNSQTRYGQVRFNGDLPSQYVMLSPHTTPDELRSILYDKWGMHEPNVIISVTGGAKNFKIRSSLAKELGRSLVKAAVSTGGWIITGGTYTGVMRLVGNAVHDHVVANDSKAIALGIATFGVLNHQNDLRTESVAKYRDQKCFHYACKESNERDKLVSLDKHHSHFILVDDGSKGEFGKEIELRARLESQIAHFRQNGEAVPIVCLLVQGGTGSLQTVHDALQQQTPVVIVTGSGGWANVLAAVYKEPFSSVNESVIAELLTEVGITYKKSEQLTAWTNLVRECLMQKRLITIFSMDNNNSVADLDKAILQAILQDDQKTTKQNLKLALSWNRRDIADDILMAHQDIKHVYEDDDEPGYDNLFDEIFTCKDIWEFFLTALTEDKTDFIDLFLDGGLDIEQHLFKEGKIEALNTPVERNEWPYWRVYKSLLGIKCDENDQNECVADTNRLRNRSSRKFSREQALREFFKWAIIHNKQKTAEVFWNAMSKDKLAASVVAHKILSSLAERSSHKEESECYASHAEAYQTLATGILSKCYEHNPKHTVNLVTRNLEDNWGNVTCLQIAASSDARDFMSHRAVQSHLDDIWYGDVNKTASGFWSLSFFWFHVITCVFCPLLIPTLPSKKKKETYLRSRTSEIRLIEDGQLNSNALQVTIQGVKPSTKSIVHKMKSMKTKVLEFYGAPFVKFLCSVLAYLMFLLLNATFLLRCTGTNEMNKPFCCRLSYLLLSWVIVLAMDEIRQIICIRAIKVKRKIWVWLSRLSNQMDLASFLFFIAGFACLKISAGNLDPLLRFRARILMAIAFVIYCLRVFSLFAVHADLGPKLLMVSKMLKDLFFFLFIWAVIVVAYGVTSQALLYPDEQNPKKTFIGAVYKPYWQLFGELFLSEIDFKSGSDEFSCNANVTRSLNDRIPQCPEENAFVPILSAIYMLLVNVLLLNLLIAMFSYTFEKLVDKTDAIWKFETSVQLGIFFQEKRLEQTQTENLLTWEHLRTESYLEDKRMEEENETSTRLDKLACALESVKNAIKDQEKLIQSTFYQCKTIQKRRNFSPVHVRARKTPYPEGDNIQRIQMKDYMVPWNVPYDEYTPKSYTYISRNLKRHPSWADREEWLHDNREKKKIMFNTYDGKNKVDRTSHVDRYMVVDGWPRNPKGRTGLAGRGVLGRYGPNHFAAWVITRWKRNGLDVKRVNNRPVIEFIFIQRKDTDRWAIPGSMVRTCKNATKDWARGFIKELLMESNIKTNQEDFLKFAWNEVFKGYSDDSRNTDNSWIEMSVSNFHDEHNSIFGQCKIEHPDEEVEWKEVGAPLDWFQDHESIIKKVAEYRGAYF
ncbi:transient receptor potential cation channel subfamily M member-like 2 isoform X1 [Clavelina lepadiformis]|uniref:transient receptor potential cation channel subfamily M member-like 2 isoform X1 n=1 Tax=Clavelina lepadiformis TaxID=159417 RepID=UPI004041261F